MRLAAQIVSWISLVVLMVPVLLYLAGQMSSLDRVKMIMTISSIVWFVTASVWMWNQKQ
jgi:hypothetical protein